MSTIIPKIPVKKSFKRAGELHDGINKTVGYLMNMARSHHADAMRERKAHLAGNFNAFDQWLRYRSQRQVTFMDIKFLLLQTTNGVVTTTVADRVSARYRQEYEARKAQEAVAS